MMTNEELVVKCNAREELKMRIKLLEEQVSAIDEALKHEMDERKVEEYSTGVYNIFYKLQPKTSFDSKKFKADNEELYKKYVKNSVNTYFTVTRPTNA